MGRSPWAMGRCDSFPHEGGERAGDRGRQGGQESDGQARGESAQSRESDPEGYDGGRTAGFRRCPWRGSIAAPAGFGGGDHAP